MTCKLRNSNVKVSDVVLKARPWPRGTLRPHFCGLGLALGLGTCGLGLALGLGTYILGLGLGFRTYGLGSGPTALV